MQFGKGKKVVQQELALKQNDDYYDELIQNDQYIEPEQNIKKKSQRALRNEDFDIYKIPGDWVEAEKHRTSRKVGTENPTDIFCECCGFQTERIQLPMQTDINKPLSYLGAGIPLFFIFIQFCIYILLSIFFISGLFNIITNGKGSNCSDKLAAYNRQTANWKAQNCSNYTVSNNTNDLYNLNHNCSITTDVCDSTFKVGLSLFNKSNSVAMINIQSVLNLIAIIPILGLFQWFRKKIRQVHKETDEANEDGTDFTICVKNIPRPGSFPNKIRYKDELKNLFESLQLQEKKQLVQPVVEKIVLTYDMTEYQAMVKELEAFLVEKKKILASFQSTSQFNMQDLEDIETKIQGKKNEMQDYCDRLKEDQNEKFAGIAFVTFEMEWMKKKILKLYGLNEVERVQNYYHVLTEKREKKFLRFKDDNILIIEEAVDPSDVYWENQHYTTTSKIWDRIKTFGFTLIILFVSFIVLLILNLAQFLDPSVGQAIGVATSIIIIIINIIIQIAMRFVAEPEHYSTRTSYLTSVCKKMIFARFFNQCLLQFFISIIFLRNYYQPGGLISNVSQLFLTQLIMVPAIAITNPFYWVRKLQINLEKKKLDFSRLSQEQKDEYDNLHEKVQNKEVLNRADQIIYDELLYKSNYSLKTQIELNRLMEYPEFALKESTSLIVAMMLFSVFYANLVPIGILFSIITLIILYWVYKYILLYQSSVLNDISSTLSKELIELMEYVPFVFGLANLFSEGIVGNTEHFSLGDISVCTYLIIIISIANAFLPMEQINEYLFFVGEDETLEKTYREAEIDFDVDYDRENPVERREAIKNWLKNKENAAENE